MIINTKETSSPHLLTAAQPLLQSADCTAARSAAQSDLRRSSGLLQLTTVRRYWDTSISADCDTASCSRRKAIFTVVWLWSNKTRKPCYREETARCRSCSLRYEVRQYIHYKFKSSQAPKARLQSCIHNGAKQNLTYNSHLRSSKDQGHVFMGQWKGDKGLNNTI